MLNRQKTLLLLLDLAGRPVSEFELMVWAFLIRNETPSRGGNAFYDFLPYERGPFSFCLRREIDTLIRDGFVKDGDGWTPTEKASRVVHALPEKVGRDGQRIVERYSGQPMNRLASYIGSVYPRFAGDNEEIKQSPAPPAVYTAGYESLSVDAFLDRLIRRGIQWIIDVRANAIARKYGFHKSTLTRLGNRVGIRYHHEPRLGIQSAFRQGLKSQADYEALFERYVSETLASEVQAVRWVAELMAEKTSVLVCMEANPRFCHRRCLANAVSEEIGLPTRDLGQM